MNKISHWQIQIADTTRSYKSTIDINVLAPEMIDAVKRVQELYPDARIYNCIHKGTFKDELYVRPKNVFTTQKWVRLWDVPKGFTVHSKLFDTKEEAELYNNGLSVDSYPSQVVCVDWRS